MIRVFGSDTCGKCQKIVNGLLLMGIQFDFVDAMADDTQPLCDENNVGSLPHVQFISDEGKIQWEKSSGVTLSDIVAQIRGNND